MTTPTLSEALDRLRDSIAWLRDGQARERGIGVADMVVLEAELARLGVERREAERDKQAAIPRRSRAFPMNLSDGELLAVKALAATGTHAEAAKLLGVALTTVNTQIANACAKAGVNNKVRLIVAYLRAQLGVRP